MQAGKLRHRLIIEQQTKSKNSFNEWVVTWTTFATVWAEIQPDLGNTTYAAKQLNADAQGKIKIRYITGVQPTMRGRISSTIYNFLSIINVNVRNNELLILYSEALD